MKVVEVAEAARWARFVIWRMGSGLGVPGGFEGGNVAVVVVAAPWAKLVIW